MLSAFGKGAVVSEYKCEEDWEDYRDQAHSAAK
jgi:hypothetical protein